MVINELKNKKYAYSGTILIRIYHVEKINYVLFLTLF